MAATFIPSFLLRYSKLKNDVFPKLKFGAKLSESAFNQGTLHPAVEGILYYLYHYGSVPRRHRLMPDVAEIQLAKDLVTSLERGEFSSLDFSVHSSMVVLLVLKHYLNSLPKHLFHSIKTKDWRNFCYLLPQMCDFPSEKQMKEEFSKDKARELFLRLKTWPRSFAYRLFLVFNNMVVRNSHSNASAALLAEYFATVILHKDGSLLSKDDIRCDLQTCMRFLILNTPAIYNTHSICLQMTFPILNLPEEMERDIEQLYY